MNEKFEIHMNELIKIMTKRVYIQLILSISILVTSIVMSQKYNDPFKSYIFIGLIGLLLLIITLLSLSIRKKLVWIISNYQSHQEDVLDYLKIYIKNTEYSYNRNLLFKLSQKKIDKLYKEAYEMIREK